MFASLGRRVARHPLRTIAVWAVVTALGFGLAIFGLGGENLFDRLTTGEPGVPGSDSDIASSTLADASTQGEQLTLVLAGAAPEAEGVADAMTAAHTDLAAIPGVATVIDPLVLPDGPANPAAAPLIAADGDGFLVVVELERGLDEAESERALAAVEERLGQVPAELADVAPGATGLVGGTTLIVDTITDQVEQDLTTGEAVALPIALLIMVLVFGGFMAASMPMVGAIASIAGGLGALLGFSYLIDLDSSVVNVVTILGLGLSIDYGLLIVSRFREELHRLLDADDGASSRRRRGDGAVTTALVRTMSTAGRTVAFSALTVAISIAGLIVFQPQILRSFGAAGVAVIVIAVASALTLVPAMLALFGRRLMGTGVVSRIPGLRSILARTADVQSEEGSFSRLAARVQRRPWLVLGGVLALLAVLALPLTQLALRNSTTELLPLGSTQREYVQALGENYPAATSPAVVVVAQTTLESAQAWTAELAELDSVASVDAPIAIGSDVMIGIRPDTDDPGGAVAADVVHAVRALDPGFQTWVTGQAAGQIDFTAALVDRLPWAAGIVVLATFVLLFLMTGSVVIPIKALLTNIISLAASLGVLVWVFQDGNLSGVLNFVSTGGIETYVVALVVAFAFGLAMDYEVFLLSRIKELHDAGYSNDDAVRLGLQRSGRIITSAAAIIIVVFTGFVFGKLLVIKEVGFSLAVAVLIDATLVRLLLVPATMTLLGKWNWWSPTFLTRLYEKLAISH
ncbi:MMPL family transporter [Pengzhenrongella sicca]|uniref:MMPL family transporter n=1 Tax=Pengzhenrongella sicca TaxID=2819238 RepID=UPI0029CA807D|nr:MMPL family transporter [Pengzhenrongella sicca]